MRIAQVTDLHMTGQLTRPFFDVAVDCTNQWQPDVVMITGDLVDDPACIAWLPDTLGRLQSRFGVYAILGNHDQRLDDVPRLRRALTESGIEDLGGRCQIRMIREIPVLLAGNECPWFPPAPPMKPDASQPRPFSILLSHSPDQFPWARRHGFDLMLAGHTHGGQIRFPIIGPIICPSRYGVWYASGLFERPPTLMHVSRGLSGVHPLRFHCPPELTLLELRCASDSTHGGTLALDRPVVSAVCAQQKVDHQRQVVGGLASDFRARGKAVVHIQVPAIVHAVQRPHGEHGGKRSAAEARRLEASGFQQATSQRPPHIVVVPRHNHTGVVARVLENTARQQSPQLDRPFEAGQSEMDVEQQQRPHMLVASQATMGDQCPPTFLEWDRQVEILDIGQGMSAENGIAVLTFLQPHVGLKDAIGHVQGVAQHVHLAMVVRSRGPVIHFLQQHDIGRVMPHAFHDPLGTIAAIDAANALVNVVGDEPESHGSPSLSSALHRTDQNHRHRPRTVGTDDQRLLDVCRLGRSGDENAERDLPGRQPGVRVVHVVYDFARRAPPAPDAAR